MPLVASCSAVTNIISSEMCFSSEWDGLSPGVCILQEIIRRLRCKGKSAGKVSQYLKGRPSKPVVGTGPCRRHDGLTKICMLPCNRRTGILRLPNRHWLLLVRKDGGQYPACRAEETYLLISSCPSRWPVDVLTKICIPPPPRKPMRFKSTMAHGHPQAASQRRSAV